ncbi:hypothetical protein AJ80_09958 [Polytolypa hystricis UAMH7299]|uniref:(4-O-methyl)-D-glucuronate--lignin esterase n=1 Tax=Polytolypa hystricis (strain UAMH7299) TaxID=1447883 RepID=A0A2B7WFT7_POLH7|nr:hypothetical protein AJ80_09958 [Polytolypa hystricis UAMH7299]
MKRQGSNVADGPRLVDEYPQWFSPVFSNYVRNSATLPYDNLELMALIAPRGLLVIENTALDFLGPWSCYGCTLAVRVIFEALGDKDNPRMSQVSHGNHQYADLTAFLNKLLLRQSVSTDVFTTDGDFNFPAGEWIDWSPPVFP